VVRFIQFVLSSCLIYAIAMKANGVILREERPKDLKILRSAQYDGVLSFIVVWTAYVILSLRRILCLWE